MSDQDQTDTRLEDQIKNLEAEEAQKKAQALKQDDDDKDAIIEALKQELEQMKLTAQRAVADYQNLKRRSEEEKSEFAKYANSKLILEILPFIDNLQRANEQLPENLKDNEWIKGVIQIEKQMMDNLQKQGLESIETIGQKLDPNLHEALMQAPGETDTVVQEVEKGYKLNGRVIRFAKVVVGNGQETQ